MQIIKEKKNSSSWGSQRLKIDGHSQSSNHVLSALLKDSIESPGDILFIYTIFFLYQYEFKYFF